MYVLFDRTDTAVGQINGLTVQDVGDHVSGEDTVYGRVVKTLLDVDAALAQRAL